MPASKETKVVVRIPLVSQSFDHRQVVTADADPDTNATGAHGQHFLNFMPYKEDNPVTGQPRYFARKRPGFVGLAQDTERPIDICLWSAKTSGGVETWAYTREVGGVTSVKTVDSSGTLSSIGTYSGTTGLVSETDITGTATIMVSRPGVTAYFAQTPSTLTEITDADYPEQSGAGDTVGRFVSMDGYVFIMCSNGKIFNSDLGSITAWSATSVVTAQAYADTGIGLERYKNTIAAFGANTIEFFENVGVTASGSGSPLQVIKQYQTNVGALSATLIIPFQDTIFWIGREQTGERAVYRLDNFQPIKISTGTVARYLESATGVATCSIYGKPHFCIIQPGSNDAFMWMYNIEDNYWWEFNSPVGPDIGNHGIFITDGAGLYTLGVVSAGTGGDAFKTQDYNISTAQNQNYPCLIVTNPIDMGTHKRKFCYRTAVIGDSTDSASTGDHASTEPSLTVYWNDNDYGPYTSWGSGRSVTLNKWLNGCGSFRRRAFAIEYSGDDELRLEALELTITEGTR